MAVLGGKIISVTNKEGRKATITTQFTELADEITKLLKDRGYSCKDNIDNVKTKQ